MSSTRVGSFHDNLGCTVVLLVSGLVLFLVLFPKPGQQEVDARRAASAPARLVSMGASVDMEHVSYNSCMGFLENTPPVILNGKFLNHDISVEGCLEFNTMQWRKK